MFISGPLGDGMGRQWTVGKRLGLGFGLAGLVVLVVAAFGYVYADRLASLGLNTERALSRNLFVAERLADHLNWVNDLQLHVTNGARFAGEPDPAVCAFGRWLDGRARLDAADDPQLARLIADIAAPHRRLHQSARSVLEASSRGGAELARQAFIDDTLPAWERVSSDLVRIKGHYELARVAATENLERGAGSSRALLLLIGLVSLAITLAMAAVTRGGLIGHLREVVADMKLGATRVAVTARQVAGSAQALSRGAGDQAASLEETSASLEEMASMTRRNADNSTDAARLTAEASRAVESSGQVLGVLVDAMSAISGANGRVATIIKTIDEIAFQTNILALNAAVEAARAGDAGLGFAVVADEVRGLAQRSAQAARDTAALIEESVGRIREGTAQVAEVGGAIATITDGVARVRALVDEVNLASQHQAQGIVQASRAVVQMEKITQNTAATAEESASASKALTAQAERSVAVISRLERLVGADAAKRQAQARPSRLRVIRMPAHATPRPPAIGAAADRPTGFGSAARPRAS